MLRMFYILIVKLFKEVWYNCSAHRSAYLFITEIISHSHIERKQTQGIFLQYSCSVTKINVVRKYLWRKIHELNTLTGSTADSQPQAQNKYVVKNSLVKNNYWWLPPLFCYVLYTKRRISQKLIPYPHIFLHLKSFLWKGPLIDKVRKKNHRWDFGLHQLILWNMCTFRSSFRISS